MLDLFTTNKPPLQHSTIVLELSRLAFVALPTDNVHVSDISYEALRNEVARFIKSRREAAKLTLEDLAHEADLTTRYFHDIEKGRRNPSLRSLLNIAQALGVPLSEIIEEAERASRSTRRRR
jgi:DNA-binding XRE family transcriptional regulator